MGLNATPCSMLQKTRCQVEQSFIQMFLLYPILYSNFLLEIEFEQKDILFMVYGSLSGSNRSSKILDNNFTA